MDESKRRSPRKRALKPAKLIFGAKDAVTVDCIIRNVSETGARLQVPLTVMIPNAFKFAHAGSVRAATVVWRKGDTMGIRFDKE